ncbi:MAG TPA: glycosyltransferase family 4 protein [Gemmatimonadales bacterium]
MVKVMQVVHQGGGAGSVTSTLHLSLGLTRAGFDLCFVCPPESEVEFLARRGGLDVLPLSLMPDRRRENALRLQSLLERHPVDLINSQSARDREALTWLGLTRRLRPIFVATRRQMPHTFPLENWMMSRVATRVIAVSRAVGEALVRRGTPRRKLAIIPNGLVPDRVDLPVSEEEREQWRRRIGWEPSRPVLGIVSRPKDQEVVLRALDSVETPLRLVLAGVDPGSAIGNLGRRAPERHAVVCLPFIPEVRPLYDLLDVVLLPSRSEGLSQSLLEAMALEKPVIASAAGGNLEVITNNVDGRLVPPLDAAAWARAIEELLLSPTSAVRLGTAARPVARERFALEQTVSRTAELYRSLLPA